MQLTLYKNFSKRKNSTKQPTGGTTIEVTLKHGTSLESPVFLLDDVDFDTNYCYALGHYYYVDDIVTVTNKLAELHCTQDAMATHKTAIGNTEAYILRAAAASDGNIADGLYPIKAEATISAATFNQLIPTTSGTFVVGIVGSSQGTAKQGSVSYYAMDNFAMHAFCAELFSEDFWQSLLTDISNPLDYVVSCYWVPIDMFTEVSTQSIRIGRFGMTATGYVISSKTIALPEKSVGIPKHPQAESRGNFLNENPFSSYEFVYSAFGSIPIPTNKLIGEGSMYAKVVLDVITGQAILELRTTNNFIMRQVTQFGVPVALSQNTIPIGSILGAASSVVGAVASGMVGNAAGAIAGGISAIDSAVDAVRGSNRITGTNGSYLGFYGDAQLIATFKSIADEDNTRKGRPLCQVKTISSLSGYIMCSDASVSIDGLGRDKDEINSYLNSGFFYE